MTAFQVLKKRGPFCSDPVNKEQIWHWGRNGERGKRGKGEKGEQTFLPLGQEAGVNFKSSAHSGKSLEL